MSKRKLFLFVALMVMGLLVACGAANLANGQNYFCPGRSYIDIIQTEPELKVRFTCTDKEQEFEVVFGGPSDSKLIDVLRDINVAEWGIGVILQDGQIVQFYESLFLNVVRTHWRADDSVIS